MEHLSNAEWELMLVCWDLGPATAREVHEVSSKRTPRDYRTVLATLRNIVKRGYLEIDKQPGPRNIPTNVFSPTVRRRRAVEHRIRRFLETDLRWRDDDVQSLLQILERRGHRLQPKGKGGKTA